MDAGHCGRSPLLRESAGKEVRVDVEEDSVTVFFRQSFDHFVSDSVGSWGFTGGQGSDCIVKFFQREGRTGEVGRREERGGGGCSRWRRRSAPGLLCEIEGECLRDLFFGVDFVSVFHGDRA